MKYDWKFKLDCVLKYKDGRRDFTPTGIRKNSFLTHVKSWTQIFDDLGVEGLKHNSNNKEWTADERFNLVAKVLAGGSIKSVARNAHISDGQLYQWVNKYREKGIDGLQYLKKGRPSKGEFSINVMPKMKVKLTPTEQEEIKLLRERNKYLEAENLYLKKIESLGIRQDGQASQGEKARIIKAVQKESNCSVTLLLSISGLSKSTYYFELQRFNNADKDKELKKDILDIFNKNKERYGVRRVYISLRNKGIIVNHKKVQRLMNEMGLSGKRKKQKYHSYQGEVGRIAENIINRNFISDEPNKKWTTDVSQFSCPFGKAYLSPILDMGMGDIVAWDLSLSPNLEQTNRMLNQAFKKYPNLEGLILHSDMGWQYQHQTYQNRLRERGIVQSMSRKGNCIDNCIMESFFGTLKNEMFYGHESEFKTFDDLYRAIDKYINYYNNERIKSKTKWMPPSKFREASMLIL